MSPPALSVVVLSWNTQDLTLACLRALATDGTKYDRQVIVVDIHESPSPTIDLPRAMKRFLVGILVTFTLTGSVGGCADRTGSLPKR